MKKKKNKSNPIIYFMICALLSYGLYLFSDLAPHKVSNIFESIVPQVTGVTGSVAGAATSQTQTTIFETARVARVIDGDTFELTDGRRVRYIGINAPETVDPNKPVECFGRQASEYDTKILQGRQVKLEKDVSNDDKYGRILRYVYLDGQFFNQLLVAEGYAYSESFPPDTKYQQILNQAQLTAQQHKLGLWAACTPKL